MTGYGFFDSTETMADDIIEGYGLVWNDYVSVKNHCIYYKGLEKSESRIGTMYIGGAGHEPGSLAFIGRDWENLRVLGDIFAAPGAKAILEGIHILDKGRGILLYCGNHEGDVLAAKTAVRMAKREGINIELFIMKDDCSLYGRDEVDKRRHVCTGPLLSRMLGAAAGSYSMEEMLTLCEKYTSNVAALAVAYKGAHHPVTGMLLSDIPEGKMSVGMGHHGEGSKDYIDKLPAKDTVDLMAERITNDIGLGTDDDVIIMLNGSGGTSYSELMVVYKDVDDYFRNRGIKIFDKVVGSFTTTVDQAGFGLGVLRVDKEMKNLFKSPCITPFRTII